MTNLKTKLMQLLIGTLVVLVLSAAPAAAEGAGIAFTNKLDMPILVQGTSYVNGMLVRGQTILIYPGKTGYDPNLMPGQRQIIIYDANRPNIHMLKKTLNFPGVDMHYLVVPSVIPGGPNSVDLVLPKKN